MRNHAPVLHRAGVVVATAPEYAGPTGLPAVFPIPHNGFWLRPHLCSIPATVKTERYTMAQFLIRKVEPELKLALQRRAARNDHSLEAEVCEIIRIVLDKEDMEAAIRARP